MRRKIELSTLSKGLLPLSLALSIVLSGCASFGKGIAEAVLEKSEDKDIRVCQASGKPFEGLAPSLEKVPGKIKVLMVHGVGDHLPGYSTEFLEKLAKELKIAAKASHYKDIKLMSQQDPQKNLGNLRISQFKNADETKELLFYELTWSEITRAEKELLSFDNSGESSFRRANVNDMLKKFSNDTGPDPILYLGDNRENILRAFSQSFCWMVQGGWDELPDDTRAACSIGKDFGKYFAQDNFAFVSHSLGSRITIDGLQRLADLMSDPKSDSFLPGRARGKQLLQEKTTQIFMLSNQLPILQLGRELPKYVGTKEDYCSAEGNHHSFRLFKKTSLVAFSDPNDILSYAIPHDFKTKYLDARLCFTATNISINVAKIMDLFGLGTFANPLEAHLGYDKDDRVIAMIANGLGTNHTAPLIKQKCEWTENID